MQINMPRAEMKKRNQYVHELKHYMDNNYGRGDTLNMTTEQVNLLTEAARSLDFACEHAKVTSEEVCAPTLMVPLSPWSHLSRR